MHRTRTFQNPKFLFNFSVGWRGDLTNSPTSPWQSNKIQIRRQSNLTGSDLPLPILTLPLPILTLLSQQINWNRPVIWHGSVQNSYSVLYKLWFSKIGWTLTTVSAEGTTVASYQCIRPKLDLTFFDFFSFPSIYLLLDHCRWDCLQLSSIISSSLQYTLKTCYYIYNVIFLY